MHYFMYDVHQCNVELVTSALGEVSRLRETGAGCTGEFLD